MTHAITISLFKIATSVTTVKHYYGNINKLEKYIVASERLKTDRRVK